MEIAQREMHELAHDEKADLAAIEAKLRKGADLEVSLHLSAIKARREAMALLTPEQRDKEKTEHEKMMKMRGERRKDGDHRGGMIPGGAGHGQEQMPAH